MKRGFIFCLLLVFLFIFPFVDAVTNVSSCGTSLNTQGETYNLNQSIGPSAGCLYISQSDITLDCKGYTISGNKAANSYGIYLFPSSINLNNVVVKNCIINDSYYGIQVYSSPGFIQFQNNTLKNNSYGMYLQNSCSSCSITQSNISFNTLAGLYFTSNADYTLTISSTNFTSNLGPAIEFYQVPAGSSISYNDFTNNLAEGIKINTVGVSTTISSNTFTRSGGSGVYLNSSNNIVLSSNTFTNNLADGIKLDVSRATISSNIITNSTLYGILLQNYLSAGSLISSNNISNNSKGGIKIFNSSSNNLLSNSIINHTSGSFPVGIYLEGNNNILANNSFIENNTYGIYLNNSNSTNITNNRVRYNTLGISLSNSFNTLFNGNNLTDNILYGLLLNQSSNNNLINASLIYNNSYGVYLVNSSNNTFSNNNVYNNTQAGIYLQGSTSTGNNIFSNSIYNHTAGLGSGIYLNGLSLINHIYNNLYLENNTYGIYLNTTNSTNITTNVVRGNTLAGISLYNSFNTTITSINLTSNALYGLLLNQSSNNNLLFTKVENSTYGFYFSLSHNNLLTNLTSYNTSIGFSFYSSQGNNLSVNNVTLQTDAAFLFNTSNATLTGDTYVTNLLSNATVMNISEGSVVNALINTVIVADYLNFSFFNATSVSLRTTNNTSAEGVGITTCTSSSKTCLLSSNLLMITNLSSTSSLYNLTLYYNASLLSGYSASELTVASYHSGWASLGTVEINTALAYVRLLGNLNSFSPFGAVAFRDIPASSSSSSSGGGGGSAPGPSLDTTTETSSGTSSTKTVLGGSAGETKTLATLLGTDRLELGFTFYKDYHRPLSFGFTRITDSSFITGLEKEIVLETLEEIKDKKGKFKLYKVDVDKKLKEEVLCKEGQEGMTLKFEIMLSDLGLTEAEVDTVDASILRIDDSGTRSSLDTKTTFLHGKLIITASLPCLSYFIVSVTPQQRITSFLTSFPKITFGSLKESVRENYLLFLLLFSVLFFMLLGGYFIQKLKHERKRFWKIFRN